MQKLSFLIFAVCAPALPMIYGIDFVTRPESRTFLHGQALFFNCSIDSFSDSGIDWVFASFLNPESEHHIVQWREGNEYVVQPGYALEQPNNVTSNLVILNPNSTFTGTYCCQYRNGQGEKSCALAKEINLPQNEVVFAGRGVLLNCAQVKAFRWYRYLESDLSDDKVIYMGSRMSDDADERFRVYTIPDEYPFERLDLCISDVQESHFGTYKCQQLSTSHCAEIIVIDSEPVCEARLLRKFEEVFSEKAELTCNVNISSNADPEMICHQDTVGNQTQSLCSQRDDGMVTCTAEVSMEMLRTTVCMIKFNPRPLQKYTTCQHASNQPSYSYKWIPPSDLQQVYSNERWLISGLIASMIANVITVSVIIFIVRRRFSRGKTRQSVSSIETCSTESESLSCSSEEKPKILQYNIDIFD